MRRLFLSIGGDREPHAADAWLEAFHRGPSEARHLVEPGAEAPGGREGAGRTAAGVDGANAAAAAVASPPLSRAPSRAYWLIIMPRPIPDERPALNVSARLHPRGGGPWPPPTPDIHTGRSR